MKIIGHNEPLTGEKENTAYQMMEDILARPLFAHLATVHTEGPRESPVWFLWEDGFIWIIGSYQEDSFPERIEKDGRSALGVVDFDMATGLVQHVGFRVRADLQPHNKARAGRLFTKYMGARDRWDPRFAKVVGDTDYVFVRMEPETAVVRDQSYTRP